MLYSFIFSPIGNFSSLLYEYAAFMFIMHIISRRSSLQTAAHKITLCSLCYLTVSKGAFSSRLCLHPTSGRQMWDNIHITVEVPYQVRPKCVCLAGVFEVPAYKQHPASTATL